MKTFTSQSSVFLFQSEEYGEAVSLRRTLGIEQAKDGSNPQNQTHRDHRHSGTVSEAEPVVNTMPAPAAAAPAVPQTVSWAPTVASPAVPEDTVMTYVPTAVKEVLGDSDIIQVLAQESHIIESTSHVPDGVAITSAAVTQPSDSSTKSTVTPVVYPGPPIGTAAQSDDDDDDEPLPEINMDSSSEEEET